METWLWKDDRTSVELGASRISLSKCAAGKSSFGGTKHAGGPQFATKVTN